MNTELLRQFEAVARLGTVTAAAEELHVTQPALSRSIARLERELGCTLLDRHGRSVALNDAGRAVLARARDILRSERLMREELAEISCRRSSLRVGTVAPAPLWRVMDAMREATPDVLPSTITLRPDEVEAAVADGHAELGIGLSPAAHPALESAHVMDEALAVALPLHHPLSTRDSVSFADIDGGEFLLQRGVGFWHDLVVRMLPHARLVTLDNRDAYLRLARETDTAIFVTAESEPSTAGKRRAIVPISDESARASFHVHIRREDAGAARGLFEAIRGAGARKSGE